MSGWSRTGRDLQGMGKTISYSGAGISCIGMFLWTGHHPDPSRQGCFVPFLNSLDSLLVIFFLVPKSLVPSCSLNPNLPILSTKKNVENRLFSFSFQLFFFFFNLFEYFECFCFSELVGICFFHSRIHPHQHNAVQSSELPLIKFCGVFSMKEKLSLRINENIW